MKKMRINSQNVEVLAQQGYSANIREFTKSIRGDPNAVNSLIDVVGDWFLDCDWGEEAIFKPALEQVEASLEALYEYLGVYQPARLKIVATSPRPSVEIYWSGPDGRPVLWDRTLVDCDDPVILATLFPWEEDVNYTLPPPVLGRASSPLHRYHPERYRSSRKFAKSFATVYRKHATFSNGAVTQSVFNNAIAPVVEEMNGKVTSYPCRYNIYDSNPSLVLNSELIFAIAYARFVQAGRQIMDFPPALCEMLSNTSISQIPVSEIRLPYVCQFLYFGPQKSLEIEPGWLVDGAYVESRGGPGEIKIVLTAQSPDEESIDKWFLRPEPSYSQSFSSQHAQADLETALEEVLNERLAYLFKKEETAEQSSVLHDAKQMLVEGGNGEVAYKISDISGKTAKIQIDEVNKRHPIFLEAIKLIINAVLYVTAYPGDIETTWSDSAPQDVRIKALRGSAKEKAKARSKLEELGYSAVHLCGKSIQEQSQAFQSFSQGSGHKSLHWRRGHWRNQAYGEGRSEHKLRWIMPMVIGAKNQPGDDPDLGHVYLVD